MAGSLTDFAENKLADHVYGGVALGLPAAWSLALFTVAPSDSAAGTEVDAAVWTNYARVSLTRNQTNFPAASGGAVSNGVVVDLGTAAITGTPPVVVAAALCDAATGGNKWVWADLAASKTINNGDPVSFPVGSLNFSFT